MSGSAFVGARFARPPAEPAQICGTFGDAWERDPFQHVWRSGDHVLGVDEHDWTRWQLAVRLNEAKVVAGAPLPPGIEVVVASGATPPLGLEHYFHVTLDTCPYAIERELNVPEEGLEAFLNYAQDMLELAEPVNRPRVGRTYAELLAETPPDIDWYIPGLLAPGWSLKIAGREKLGKGTLTHYFLSKLERGEDTIFGPSREATALYVTEEPIESIHEKAALFGVQRSTVVFGHELLGKTWLEQVDLILQRALDDGHKIIVLDNFSRRAGVEDEAGTELSLRFDEIDKCCKAHGLALIVDHHHRKAKGPVLDQSRGSTSFAGAADVNLEMVRTPESDPTSRKRALTATGRRRATNWQKVIELSEDGRDYAVTKEGAPDRADVDDGRLEADLDSVHMCLAHQGAATVAAMQKRLAIGSQKKAERLLKTLYARGRATRERPKANAAYVYTAVTAEAVSDADLVDGA